jgi:hypothetical protein
MDIMANGDIITLTHRFEPMMWRWTPLPFGNNYLAFLSSEGVMKNKISFLDLLKDVIPPDKIHDLRLWLVNPKAFLQRIEMAILPPRDIFGKPTDLFHSNTVEIIDRDIDDHFREGRILICVRNLDLVGLVDIDGEELVWHWGPGTLERPHHPTLLDNDNILIFDNGNTRKYSRIVELNPESLEIEWMYEAHPRNSFYTSWGGSNQRLPNGNTLIVDSGKGRAFEVTRDGEIVWDFYNPDMILEENLRATIYRMRRILDPVELTFLNKTR